MQFTDAWLDSLTEASLCRLYNETRSKQRRARQLDLWGFAYVYGEQSAQICDALYRYYCEMHNPSFCRNQTILFPRTDEPFQ